MSRDLHLHRHLRRFIHPLAASCTLLALGGPVSACAEVASTRVAGFSHVRSLGGIDEYRLDSNGLTVLLKSDHSAPVVTYQVTYRVGSRNEVTGTTGATHILEHLMFKGSDRFNRAGGTNIDQYLERVGARYNATTSLDRTNYYGTFGRDHLEGYIAIESDRMRNLWLHDADRQAEMTVVRNEYERGENSPGNALYKEVIATAYRAHPYRHATIGWRSDIENVPIQKLREFYDTFYWPDNATVTVVGDIEPAATLALIGKYYGPIPKASGAIPAIYTKEPPQTGARRLVLKRHGPVGIVLIAFHGPDGRSADLPALTVLGEILSTGKSSRLFRALIDQSLATSVGAGIRPQHDPGLFLANASLAPDASLEQVEKVILAEIERVKQEGVDAQEIAQVVNQYRASEAYQRDGTAAVAAALNESIATGDWTLYVTFMDRIATVTPADVQRVARKYLGTDQSTTGWFVPMVTP